MLGRNTFSHGVHPHDHKEQTAGLPTEHMPIGGRYVLPLSQHLGAPAEPVVAVGEKVRRGQVIARPAGFVSTTHHAPVSGVVTAIELRRHPFGNYTQSIEIEADPYDAQRVELMPPLDPEGLSGEAFVRAVQEAGIVGLGGAAFPSHVKYRLPEGKRCERLVINGCECEPFLTCDHRLMVERAAEVVAGARIIAARLGARETAIGVEANKPDAIAALRAVLKPGEPVEVRPLQVKYPQGAEKMLIKALFDLEVPAGGLPLDLGVVVNNVGTALAVWERFHEGRPLVDRVVTVAGPAVRRPANVVAPIGTMVRDLLDFCGGLAPDTQLLIMGGPMMGQPLSSVDVPILKGTSGVLAFGEADTLRSPELPCVRCGRCLDACPVYLNPSQLARLARAGRFEDTRGAYVMDCMECGGCSFACPSSIPIVQLIRIAKTELRRKGKP